MTAGALSRSCCGAAASFERGDVACGSPEAGPPIEPGLWRGGDVLAPHAVQCRSKQARQSLVGAVMRRREEGPDTMEQGDG